MAEPRVVLTDIVMGESARWHDGRLWFCDWGAGSVICLDDDAKPQVVAGMSGLPFGIDRLPGGDLLILDGPGAKLPREGSTYAGLGHIDDQQTLYTVTADYSNPAAMFTSRTGRLFATALGDAG